MSKETRQSTTEQLRSVSRDDRTVDLVISTFDIDSYGTRIDQAGWDFDGFRKNPVICLQHDDRGYTGSNGLPIANGIPETIRVEGGKTFMRIRFPEAGKFPLADQVFELVADGFMRGVSVGFEPIDHEDIQEGEGDEKRSVRVYRKQRLLEVSLVTIPSNDNALVQRAAKLDADVAMIRSITEQVETLLDEANKAIDPTEFEKYRSYFEKKQPANREATKVMERFYKRILDEELPADEVAAWKRMGEAIDAMESHEEKVEAIETPEEKPEELPPPSISETPAEAPQDARKAFVQVPLTALPALRRSITEACVEAAVKASQQGIPQSQWDGVIDSTGKRFQESIHHFQLTA